MTEPEAQPQQFVYARTPHSSVSTASLVLALLGAVAVICGMGLFGFMSALPSVVAGGLGHQGMHETRDGAHTGRGQAVAGLMLSYGALALIFFAFVIGAVEPAGNL